MAVKKVALANRWVSVTDVFDRLRRARENREQQAERAMQLKKLSADEVLHD